MSIFRKTNPAALSPYVTDPNRLGDVVAAIQTMGTYKFYKRPFDKWADRIAADPAQSTRWQRIFREHPEFFRLDSSCTQASLVWRRQFPKRWDVDAQRPVTAEEYRDIVATQAFGRLSRAPLSANDIKTLIDTAVSLHSHALERERDKRWWIPFFSAVGAVVGSLIGTFAPLIISFLARGK